MTAPDAVPPQAIEAAAEASHTHRRNDQHHDPEWANVDEQSKQMYRDEAEAALAAAYPVIRESIAYEVMAAPLPSDVSETINVKSWFVEGVRWSASIVRGGDRKP